MDNTKNVIIGILAAIVVIGGGYLLVKNGNAAPSEMATTTAPATAPSNGQQPPTSSLPPPPASSGAPIVETNNNGVVSNSTSVVTGRVTPNGAPTTYWYEYGEESAPGARTLARAIGSGYSAIPSPGYITGLKANTSYYFRLSAQNRHGVVNGATAVFTTNPNPPPTGSAPAISTTAATDVSRTTAILNGRVDPNSSSTSYWFEYGESTDLGNVTQLQSAGSGSVSVPASVSISDLAPQTKYYFRLNAQNQFGTVNGATMSFTTQGPLAPGRPTADTTSATKVSTSTAAFNARINPNGVNTTYWFEYGVDSVLGNILGTVTGSQMIPAGNSTVSVSADVSGLSNDTRYYYRVVASNQYGTVRGDVVTLRT